MKNIFTLLIIIFLSHNAVFSQNQVIFKDADNENYNIKYRNKNSFEDKIVQKLAVGNSIKPKQVRVKFSYKQVREIRRVGEKLNLSVTLTKFKLSGHIKYKNIFVNEFLTPEKISLRVKLKKGNKVIKTFNITDAIITGQTISVANVSYAITNSGGGTYTMLVDSKKFNFTNTSYSGFVKKAKYIRKYYDENRTIKTKLRSLSNINADENELKKVSDIQVLYRYKETATNNVAYAKGIKNKGFYRNLRIDRNDPLKLKGKVSNLKNKSTNLLNACNNILNNLHLVYYDRGMDLLTKRKPRKAEKQFNKAIKIKHNYGPAHYQLAEIYYNSGFIDQAVDKIFEIKKMHTDKETKRQTLKLTENIYRGFILDAEGLNNRKRYDEALEILIRANELCTAFKRLRCSNRMDREFARAVGGKYDFLIQDIDLAINQGRLVDAENLVNAAYDYQRENRDLISSPRDVDLRLGDVYIAYLSKGDLLAKKKQYQKAIVEYNDALRICKKYPAIKCTAQLEQSFLNARTGIYNNLLNDSETAYRNRNYANADKYLTEAVNYRKQFNLPESNTEAKIFIKIKQAVYADFIREGKNFMKTRNYSNALKSFEDAKNVENTYNVTPDRTLTASINSAAEGACLQTVEQGMQKVRINDLRSARDIYRTAKDISQKYNLTKTNISSKLDEFKDAIFKQECVNAQNKYDAIYNDALSAIANKDFIKGNNIINEAIKFSSNNADCDINTNVARNKQNEIAKAVNYQIKLVEINKNINQGNYQSAINEYLSAGNYFSSQRISTFGLQHTKTLDFILSKHSGLVNFAVGYYTDKSDFDSALILLKTLYSRNYSSFNTKIYQKNLGAALARKDHAENPNGNKSTNITKHIGGGVWFRFFKRAYRRQWRKL